MALVSDDIDCNQASVRMGFWTGLSCVDLTLLPWPRATSKATDSFYLFESRLLRLHGVLMLRHHAEEEWSVLYMTSNNLGWFQGH
jgi:hypothetical protein